MSEKEQLYYLIIEVLKGNYEVKTFCNEFTRIFDLEIDYKVLSKVEYECLNELADKAARFSNYEEDLKMPHVYFNEAQIIEEVKKTMSILENEISHLHFRK